MNHCRTLAPLGERGGGGFDLWDAREIGYALILVEPDFGETLRSAVNGEATSSGLNRLRPSLSMKVDGWF